MLVLEQVSYFRRHFIDLIAEHRVDYLIMLHKLWITAILRSTSAPKRGGFGGRSFGIKSSILGFMTEKNFWPNLR